MKTIKINDYKGDGIFINLDISYIPYQKLIYNPENYLVKNKIYYIYCNHGYKSNIVANFLYNKGYNVIKVIK